jgi:uncharacterized protein
MIYLDSSALVKLAHAESHSQALAEWLAARSGRLVVSSALAGAEMTRALRRSDPEALPQVPHVLARLFLIPVDDRVLGLAGALPDPLLRTLDAIHLATARLLAAPGLSFVTYDRRLRTAATVLDLDASAPGS